MLMLVRGTARAGLSAEAQRQLQKQTEAFYAHPPAGVRLICDYILADQSGSFSVLEVPDRATLEALLAPFEPLVEVEIHPVIDALAQAAGPG